MYSMQYIQFGINIADIRNVHRPVGDPLEGLPAAERKERYLLGCPGRGLYQQTPTEGGCVCVPRLQWVG